MNWWEVLKVKRKEYHISQDVLAEATGISKRYLRSIENGKVTPTEKLKDALLEIVEQYNPDKPLTMLFDYVRIRFPTMDIKEIITKVLRLNVRYMEYVDYGFYSYSEHYVIGDIFILTSPDAEKGVLVELKGRGCRQFECYLDAQGRTWYDFFETCNAYRGIYKRIDLAINDTKGILNVPRLVAKCEAEECVTFFRTYRSYRIGELKRQDEKIGMGNTLYIGSFKSEVYFCIYEKDYEQYVKYGIPLEETLTKNRFEIRLKDERAQLAIEDIMIYRDAHRTAFSIINRYVRFVDKEESKKLKDCKINREWARFIDKECNQLKLTTEKEPYSFDKTLNWISHQVAPTLKAGIKLDSINGTNHIGDIITQAKISDRLELLIKQHSVPIEERII